MFQTILKAYLLEATRGLNQDSLAPLLLCHQNKEDVYAAADMIAELVTKSGYEATILAEGQD